MRRLGPNDNQPLRIEDERGVNVSVTKLFLHASPDRVVPFILSLDGPRCEVSIVIFVWFGMVCCYHSADMHA